jgi:hypothetical protein
VAFIAMGAGCSVQVLQQGPSSCVTQVYLNNNHVLGLPQLPHPLPGHLTLRPSPRGEHDGGILDQSLH